MTAVGSSARKLAVAALVVVLLVVPVYSVLAADSYLLTLSSRILVFALAAVGLNIVLGYGGMVSMGHAMYMGLGAYTVLIMQVAGWSSGWAHLLVLVVAVGIIALAVGWVTMRTHGIAFIMITLAFAQLFYFLFISLKAWGGDEGKSLPQPSDFGPLTGHPMALYVTLLACLAITVYGSHRMMASRFGLVLRATRLGERRVRAVGTSTLPYRLAAYVISAWICALAGFFLANLSGFVSPAYLSWTVSGELIVMVVLGGAGTIIGPVLGAIGLMLLEELLKAWTEHWMMILGPLIVLMVLGLRRGIWGLFDPAPEKSGGKS